MDYEGWLWLPCLATVTVILLSLLVLSSQLRKKRGVPSGTTTTAQNTFSASACATGIGVSEALPAQEYEVFLSFRGNDTRLGFTDYLYNNLVDAGIRTFRDDDELRVGEEIGPELLKAINESKICIPIFSQNYASSKWCLLELAQMLERHKTMRHQILPIFYDVEPHDVRHQTGSYKEAFRQHLKRFDAKKVQAWKEALREVGELKGWELKKETNGRQGEFAKKVVSNVLLELKKNCMDVTDNLVGIDQHMEKMTGLINVDSIDVWIVGIHGMGGIGKTTIAKVAYNQFSEQFDCCCFLEGVREMSQHHNGLLNLQKQLISKIRKAKCDDITTVDEGINMIKKVVSNKKVLIVLDDVYEKYQFTNLVGKHDWFGSGSRIIVTTRNREVLEALEVDGMYEPHLMEDAHALQLFSKHAFRNDFPPEDCDNISREVVSTTGGLPLALEIIGSHLFRKGKVEWEETLKKLKDIPNQKVMEKLKISYDALEHEEKQLFLDIACHFNGVDKTLPFYMWEDCKFYPLLGINGLVLKSLVKIGDDNVLRMHDQIRDLGRAIICEEKDLGERSRLWIEDEAFEILESQMGTRKVEALCLLKRAEHCFTNDHFGKLQNLRFLGANYTNLNGDFKHLLSNLRWLQWRGCTENSRPINFHLKNLVILDLSDSFITENWEVWSQIKMSKKLKVLDLSYCTGLCRTPDLSTFVSLERLILRQCKHLDEIGPWIGSLINLKVLDISRTPITKLPDVIGNLEKLEEINALGCCYFDGLIPSTIGRLSSLRVLNLMGTVIRSLPTSICGLSLIQTLDLTTHCDLLQSLPELPPSLSSLFLTCRFCDSRYCDSYFPSSNQCDISRNVVKLPKLETLCLFRSKIITLPVEIGVLSGLKVLHLGDCTNLRCILGLPSSLFELHLSKCKSLERLPDLSNLKNLSKLKLDHCPELKEIQVHGKLESLMSLEISWCEKLAKLDGLEQLESLRYLEISYCKSLESLPDLSKKLQVLNISCNWQLMNIQGLVRSECLKHLDMNGCTSVKKLPDLSNLGMLKRLDLSYCKNLVDVGGLRGLKSLEKLFLTDCGSFERLPDLSNLKILKELAISGGENLIDDLRFKEWKSLEWLMVPESPKNSFVVSNLKRLKVLKDFRGEIQGFEELKSSTLWNISESKSIEKLQNSSYSRDELPMFVYFG